MRTQRTGNLRIKLGMNPHINLGKKKISFCSLIVSAEEKTVGFGDFINDTNHKLEKEDKFNIGQIIFNSLFLKDDYLGKTTEKIRF